MGIRDLCWLEEDLAILAGPTMDIAGPQAMHPSIWSRFRSASPAGTSKTLEAHGNRSPISARAW